jgi:signal transduction histidine kinase
LYESNGFVRLEMKDNGPGLDEETQRRIFEPFYTMKGVGQASVGMGLSVSYKIIVESHKGELSVSSGVESGAVFTIALPIA